MREMISGLIRAVEFSKFRVVNTVLTIAYYSKNMEYVVEMFGNWYV